jgi:hypothetical protein
MGYLKRLFRSISWYLFSTRAVIASVSAVISMMVVNKVGLSIESPIIRMFAIDVFLPLTLYIGMANCMIYIYMATEGRFCVLSRLISVFKKTWWIFLLKLFWNICTIIIMGNDYTPDINTSLLTALLLFAMWMVILLLASYYVPKAIVAPNASSFFSFSGLKVYLAKSMGRILLIILLAGIGFLAFLFFISMVMAYLNSFLETALNYSFSKIAVEDMISFSAQVFYANALSAAFLNVYLKASLLQQSNSPVQKVKMKKHTPRGIRGRRPTRGKTE